ncbi:MAG: flagellar hook-basal body complex protein [Loktanella sp.]|nr:flagellar hook-basal body complex protein [Loktanella sp.]
MSFYTALTGLNGAQADISATSNNIANVGTTGFKSSRAEFGDIFATSPLQNSSSSIGSGAILKGVKQQFTQGNIASSLNALDLAISGQGFFALKPSLTSTQVVYTRNGSFNVDNNRNVVDSSGQFLLTYPVNDDGSVTAKDINSATPLRLPVTSGDPQATTSVDLAVNLPASAEVITSKDKFANGYTFDPNDPESFTNSTSFTIFDDLGNPTIATVYFIKTQRATGDDPTNKFETRLVIDNVVVNPDLVPAVDQRGRQIFIDQFGNQTTEVPDPSYFNTGRSTPLYKQDDLRNRVPSQPAAVTGDRSGFDFGDEGSRRIEIITDPMQFGATFEADPAANPGVYWGRDFLLVNIDDGTRPVSINIRAGSYNPDELAAEVERAINEAYDDANKLQIRKGIDDKINIEFFQSQTDGVSSAGPRLAVDLLQSSFVSTQAAMGDLTVPSVSSFDLDVFLAHAQVQINKALNASPESAPGSSSKLFAKVVGSETLSPPPKNPEIISFVYDPAGTGIEENLKTRHVAYTNVGNRPALTVFDNKLNSPGVSYSPSAETITITLAAPVGVSAGQQITLAGPSNVLGTLNGRSFVVPTGQPVNGVITIPTSGLGLSGDPIDIPAPNNIFVLAGRSTDVEAFFQGSDLSVPGSPLNFNNQRIVLRETDTARAGGRGAEDVFKNFSSAIDTTVNGLDLFGFGAEPPVVATGAKVATETTIGGTVDNTNQLTMVAATGTAVDSTFTVTVGSSLVSVELRAADTPEQAAAKVKARVEATLANVTATVEGNLISFTTTEKARSFEWVDERNPPVKIGYNYDTQSIEFIVDQRAIGPGGSISDVSRISITSAASEGRNGIGLPGSTSGVAITGVTKVSGQAFILDGRPASDGEQRFGASVGYDREARAFTFESGTTGKEIGANKAIGVPVTQSASNIQVGRLAIDALGKAITGAGTVNLASRTLSERGFNDVMGVGLERNVEFREATGLRSEPARATGGPAKDPLNSQPIFLNAANRETTFNVSVNGVNAVIDLPSGNFIGTTLAEALEKRINQMRDPVTGQTIGGVTVRYQAAGNNFVFTTGTTGDTSTIRIKGPARLGLDDVALGVGSIPTIVNLVQATNENGVPLFVNANGDIVESDPGNVVSDFFPLYLNEGELTFDRSGRLISPQGLTRYESQSETFSISLDIDYSASSQLATPFAVNNLEQNGFTSGRLDGLSIDATGLLRANYTNGQNKPLGKIVLANFNNQNGLKQVGNATYVETATSGGPIFGEAGTEGFGSIQSGALERSNVDITEELVNLITAQRNFQAASKAIETSTQLTQTIINIRT